MAKRIKAKEWIKEHKKALVIGASATAAVIGAVVVAKVKGKKIEEIDIPEIGTVVDDYIVAHLTEFHGHSFTDTAGTAGDNSKFCHF